MDTIRNTGSADITVSSVKLSGVNSADFSLTQPTLPMIIVKGGIQTVQLCYTPSARGLSTASLDVIATSSGRTQNQSLAINGTGQVGCMSAAPNPVPFGSTSLPAMTMAKTGSDLASITVTNCGDVPMSFSAALGSGTSANYILQTAATPVVAPNGTATINVKYSPDTIGASTGSVVITPSEGSVTAQTVALGGVGAGVYIVPSGTPTDTRVGESSTFTVTLLNNGNIAWTPNAGTITAGSSDFTVGTSPASIAPGASGTVTVTFTPTTTGSRTGTLAFSSPDIMPLGSTLPYTFTANGLAAAGVKEVVAKDGFAIGASYPNPASSMANVVVTSPRDAKAVVTLVRLDGSQVATVFNGSLTNGQNRVNFDVTNLASGTYFYVLESGNTRLVRQMVVAK